MEIAICTQMDLRDFTVLALFREKEKAAKTSKITKIGHFGQIWAPAWANPSQIWAQSGLRSSTDTPLK